MELTTVSCQPSIEACAAEKAERDQADNIIDFVATGHRRQAYKAAIARAKSLEYCETAAVNLAMQCRREIRPWESPEDCAVRIVRPKHESATAPTLPEAG